MNNGDDDTHDFEADEPTIPDRGSTDEVFIKVAAKRLGICVEALTEIGKNFDLLSESEQSSVWDGIHAAAGQLAENIHDLRRYAAAKVRRAREIEDGK